MLVSVVRAQERVRSGVGLGHIQSRHAYPRADHIDGLVDHALVSLSELSLGLDVVQKHFTIPEYRIVGGRCGGSVVRVVREVFDRTVATSLVILAARIVLGRSVSAYGDIVRSGDGLRHTRVTAVELLVVLHRLPSLLALERSSVSHKIMIGKGSGQ